MSISKLKFFENRFCIGFVFIFVFTKSRFFIFASSGLRFAGQQPCGIESARHRSTAARESHLLPDPVNAGLRQGHPPGIVQSLDGGHQNQRALIAKPCHLSDQVNFH